MLFIETFIFIGRRRDSHAPLRGQYQFSSRLTTLFANLEGIQIRKQAGHWRKSEPHLVQVPHFLLINLTFLTNFDYNINMKFTHGKSGMIMRSSSFNWISWLTQIIFLPINIIIFILGFALQKRKI